MGRNLIFIVRTGHGRRSVNGAATLADDENEITFTFSQLTTNIILCH